MRKSYFRVGSEQTNMVGIAQMMLTGWVLELTKDKYANNMVVHLKNGLPYNENGPAIIVVAGFNKGTRWFVERSGEWRVYPHSKDVIL